MLEEREEVQNQKRHKKIIYLHWEKNDKKGSVDKM
jgi:hypothetical protein